MTTVERDTAPRSGVPVMVAVWRAAGPWRGRLARGIAFRFGQAVSLGLSFAAVVGVLTALRSGPLTGDTLWVAVVVVAVSLVGQLVFGFLALTDNWVASFAMVGRLRLRVLDRLRQLPMRFHVQRQQGDTVTAVTSDMTAVESFACDGFPTVAQAIGLPLVVVVALAVVDPALAGATVLSIVVATPVYFWANRTLAALGVERQDRQSEAVARMLSYVQGIVVIRAFNQTGDRQRGFRTAVAEFRDVSERMVRKLLVPIVAFVTVVQLGVPLVIAAAGYWLVGGRIDGATALIFLVMVLSVYVPLQGLVGVMETLRLADASMTRVERITDAPVQAEPERPSTPDGASVVFDGVSFGYRPDRPVVRDVSFTVPERSMTAIVGPSGAGKSTLLTLVARFWDVDAGAVRIGGVDVREMTTQTLYAHLTVMFQDVYLFQGTIFDNIAFGRPDTTLDEVRAAAAQARADEFVRALPDGYGTRVGEGGATLSGGERQRIAIARAILKDAPVVLLDEATSAIDPTNEKHVSEALAALVADKTLLVVAHKLSTIRSASQVVAVEDGRVAEIGTPAELLATGGVFARFHAQRERAQGWRLRG